MAYEYYLDRNKKNIYECKAIISTLPQIVSLFFIGIENSTTPLTRLNYARDLKIFFSYLIEKERDFLNIDFSDIAEIDIVHIEKIDSLLIERFLSYISMYNADKAKTITNTERGKMRKLSSIRSLFKFLFNRNIITKNVAAKVQTPKMHSKAIVRLEINEVTNILNLTDSPESFSPHQKKYLSHCSIRDNAILTLLLGTGIRVSECVGLNIADISFDDNSFKVIRKGGNQTILYFSNEVAEVMDKYMQYRKSLPAEDNALFLSLQNKRLGVRSIELLVKKYAKIIAPLKNISPHKLRSTYGTNLYRETGDIYVVADVLGHKDINTTKTHYAAISEDIRKNAANKVKLRKD